MKKILLLLCTLLAGVGVVNAEDYTWESRSDWTQASGGVANIYWFGATTPGSATTTFTLSGTSGFQIMQQTTGNTRYIAIATANSSSSLSESDVVAVSNNSLAPSSSTATLETYTFDSDVTLTGGTTYYIVFLSSNTPTDGAYSVQTGRISLNHTDYGTYAPGCSNAATSTWWPYYKATLTSTVSLVNVTYELYESDGTTLVSSEVAQQEPNSAVSVPDALANSSYFDYSTEGSVGDGDCTIKVTRTPKAGIVYPITNLSNNKAYKIVVPRGIYTTASGYLANTVKSSSYDINNFALISYEDNYYMWSIADSKFAGSGLDLSDTPSPITFTANTVPSYLIKSGSLTLNASSGLTYGASFDSWSAADDGNRCVIYEVEDFDPTDALAALEEYFHPAAEAVYDDVIAQLETYTYGTALGQYSFTGDYASYTAEAATIIANLKSQGYSEENLTYAQALLDATAINLPTAGFYRIKGATSGYYLAAGLASNSKFAMSTATDATTIFYYDGTKLTNLSSGLCNGMTASAWTWTTGDAASQVTFQDGLTNGGYAIQSADAYFYDNGDNSSSADRGANLTISAATNQRYVSWALEEVTTLPVTITAAGYATLCAPVALTIPVGVTAYTGAIEGSSLKLTALDGPIPANTAVILEGTQDTYDFAITTAGDFSGTNHLQGTIAATATPEGSLTLGYSDEVLGFYSYGGTTLPGFKAYIVLSSEDVKALSIVFEGTTALKAIDATVLADRNVYDLAGRRVHQVRKGIYVVDGRKVMVK